MPLHHGTVPPMRVRQVKLDPHHAFVGVAESESDPDVSKLVKRSDYVIISLNF